MFPITFRPRLVSLTLLTGSFALSLLMPSVAHAAPDDASVSDGDPAPDAAPREDPSERVDHDSSASGETDALHLGPQRKVGLFVDPLSMLFGVINVEADYLVVPHLALTLSASYLDWGVIKGAGVDAGVQYFFQEESFNGPYVASRLGLSKVSVTVDGDDAGSGTLFDFGATAGYQWQFDSGICVRLGAGAAYYSATNNVAGASYGGFRPALNGAVGYTF